jgi:hypothetical protein
MIMTFAETFIYIRTTAISNVVDAVDEIENLCNRGVPPR